MITKYAYQKFILLYIAVYFSIGAIMPLTSIYLKNKNLNGQQIGVIVSMGALFQVLLPPVWAYISDITHKHKLIFLILVGCSFTAAIFIPFFTTYYGLVFIFGTYYFFYNSIIPMLDGITLKSVEAFGRIRRWGAIGFAIACVVTSKIVDLFGLNAIIVILALSFAATFVITSFLKVSFERPTSKSDHNLEQILKDKSFLIFLLFVFFIGASISGNNAYMSLYFKSLNAPTTIIGFAFMLFGLSEVPFMTLSIKWLKKHNVEVILIVSTLLGIVRWTFYSFRPSPTLILIFFALQGAFYGTFIVGTGEYVKQNIPKALQSTAMALQIAMSFGLGGVVSGFLSGYIYDHFPTHYIYYLYNAYCIIALLIIVALHKYHTLSH